MERCKALKTLILAAICAIGLFVGCNQASEMLPQTSPEDNECLCPTADEFIDTAPILTEPGNGEWPPPYQVFHHIQEQTEHCLLFQFNMEGVTFTSREVQFKFDSTEVNIRCVDETRPLKQEGYETWHHANFYMDEADRVVVKFQYVGTRDEFRVAFILRPANVDGTYWQPLDLESGTQNAEN